MPVHRRASTECGAVGVVEREIMDLPDGVNFKPDAPMTGLE